MKEVKDNLCKFYTCYEDAEHDVNRQFFPVPCEGAIFPNQAIVRAEVDFYDQLVRLVGNEPTELQKNGNDFAWAICKKKTMKRETLFGTIFEDVYIFHNIDEQLTDNL